MYTMHIQMQYVHRHSSWLLKSIDTKKLIYNAGIQGNLKAEVEDLKLQLEQDLMKFT